MSEQLNGLTVEQATEKVMESLEANVAKQLENYTKGIDAVNQMAILGQKMATQQFVLSVAVRQRIKLEKQLRLAEGNPLMEEMVAAQIESLEEHIVEIMEEADVPNAAAKKALKAAASTVQIEVVHRNERGQIAAFTKNGTHN